MKVNAGETPLEPIFVFDPPNVRCDQRRGKRKKPPFDVLHGGEHWETELCALPLKRLVAFNDLARAVVIRLNNIHHKQNTVEYLDVLRHIEAKLLPVVRAYPGLASEPSESDEEDEQESWPLLTTLIRNICRCIPNEASERMLGDFFARLQARDKELQRPHPVLRAAPIARPRR